MFTYIVTVRVINALRSRRHAPASHTAQAWMWRLYIRPDCRFHIYLGGTSTAFGAVSTSTLPAPVRTPLRAQSASVHLEKAGYKLSSIDLHLYWLACDPQVIAWILNWSCLYCKYIHYECINIYITCSLGPSFSFFILKLGLLSYSVCGDEANCTYSEECPGQHLCHHGDGYPQQIMSS